MSIFTPPVVNDRSTFTKESTEEQKGLFKFFTPWPRYVSVFFLSDGSFAQDTATVENSNTNTPYPWDPDNPSGAYVVSDYWDVSQSPAVYTTTKIAHSVWIVSVVNGVTEVSPATAAALTAYRFTATDLGYASCLS